ncbi:MAG: CYTH domain-containing protein [Gammaproteobacteria bacterium]|nr:CYTH domain-containing protein [Gammaproteobacteria bacterium]
MALEIERKFLLANDAWRAAATNSETLWQGYLTTNERCSVRVRVAGDQGWLNIKSTTLGVIRHEFEYAVPATEARELLDLFCAGRSLGKTRHHVPVGAHVWEIDVFEGENVGLIVAEIELSAEDESFERPAWLGAEVSGDPRYYNTSLIAHPYSQWTRT